MSQVQSTLPTQTGNQSSTPLVGAGKIVDAKKQDENVKADLRPRYPIKDIYIPKNRVRTDYGDIGSLAQSLKTHGLIHAIVLGHSEDQPGKLELVAGGRRLRAAIFAGWAEIPYCLREDLDPLKMKEIELEENLQRKNIDWPEQVENLRQIDELKRKLYGEKMQGASSADPANEGWTQEKTAKLVGISEAMLSKQLKLAKKLKARPDLKDKIKHLPLTQAIKQVVQIEKSEQVERLHTEGKLKLHSKFIEGDSLELIKQVEADSIGMILTDPPFGIDTLADLEGDVGSATFTALLKPDDNLNSTTALDLMSKLLPELFRVLKPSRYCYMFCAIDLFGELKSKALSHGFEVQNYPIIWHKQRTTNQFTGYNYQSCYESCMVCIKPPKKRRLIAATPAIIPVKPVSNAKRCHIFQKPVELLSLLIKNSSDVGDIILDPFAGSASTIVAARKLGRCGLGFEKNHDHYLAGQARLLKTDIEEALDLQAST